MKFEWDNNKAQKNHRKHGVHFEEATTVFYDADQIAFCDPDHSNDEDRELLIGYSARSRFLIARGI